MNNTTNLGIDSLILSFTSVAALTSSGILFLIFYHRQQYPINAPIFLMCNTYLSIIFTCFFLLDTYAHDLYGNLYPVVSFNNWWCDGRAYFLHVGMATLYHSFILQTIFRFFRIVFYKSKQLQTLRFTFRLVLIQWLIDFIIILPILFLHYFQYISQYYYCHIPFTNLQGLLLAGSVIYYIPIIIIGSIYFYILYFMKKTKSQSILQNRRRTSQRNLIVLRRIVTLVAMLFILCFPSVILSLIHIITGYLSLLIYHFQWLTFVFSLSILPTISAFLTPQISTLLTGLWRQKRRIHPVIQIQRDQNNQTIFED